MAVIEEVTDDTPAPPAKKEKAAFIPADKFEVRLVSNPFRKQALTHFFDSKIGQRCVDKI